MAYPAFVTASSKGAASSAASDFTMTGAELPASRVSGNLLIAVNRKSSDAALYATPANWTDVTYQNSGTRNIQVWARISTADASDDLTIVRTAGINGDCACIITQISGWYGTISGGIEGTVAYDGATTVNPDPPQHVATWGAAENLWMLAFGYGTGAADPTGVPTNYENATYKRSTGVYGTAAIATKTAASSSSTDTENPGTWTVGTATNGYHATLAIRPAAGASVVVPSALRTQFRPAFGSAIRRF